MADKRDHPIDEPSEISRSYHGRQRRGLYVLGGRRRDGRNRSSDRPEVRPLGNPVTIRPGIVRGTRGSVSRGCGGHNPTAGMGLGVFGGHGGDLRRAAGAGFSDHNRGGATVGQRSLGPRITTINYSAITAPGLPQPNIPTRSGERSGSFDMSDLWSTLPRDSQHHTSGPPPYYSSQANDRLLTGQAADPSSSITSETDLVNRLESAFCNADNATCKRLRCTNCI
jgi:hypothetical protein